MDFVHLRVDTTDEGVRTIRLDRADRLNAVNPRLSVELPAAVHEAAADRAVRVIVITGNGRGFCAGLDLNDPAGLDDSPEAQRDPYAWVGRWVQAIVGCEKPVIAAINGPAAGAGFGLALACDLRIMAASATCTAGYVRRGLSPDAGTTWFLPRLVGHARATEILLTGRDLSAQEAQQIGLCTAVYDDAIFAEAVAAFAAQLASGPPLAFAKTKQLLLASADVTLDAQLRDELTAIKQCFASEDVREALAAFREKRMPVFRGR
ncbi:MAG: hypothetical protein RLZZ621_1287 [Gemmatimonadota bacterium]